MDHLKFLRALSSLGIGINSLDLGNASDGDMGAIWERFIQSPLAFSADRSRRLTLADPNSSILDYETLHSALSEAGQAAYQFFLEAGQEVRDVFGIVLNDANESLRRTCFAEIHQSLNDANAAASAAGIPIRFCEEISAGEKWMRQVQSGKIVGMDDPIWMAKAQEQIDAALDQMWVKKKSS